jgi:hypothetical protein
MIQTRSKIFQTDQVILLNILQKLDLAVHLQDPVTIENNNKKDIIFNMAYSHFNAATSSSFSFCRDVL